jgi:hypothetical protein
MPAIRDCICLSPSGAHQEIPGELMRIKNMQPRTTIRMVTRQCGG